MVRQGTAPRQGVLGCRRRTVLLSLVRASQLPRYFFSDCALSGYLPAVFYLVTYAKDTLSGLSPSLTVIPVTLLNIAATCGRIGVGVAADKIGPTNAFIVSVTFAGLAQLLIWNFAKSYAAVIAFAIICGAFGGCFVSLTGPVAAHVFGAEKLAGLSGLLTLFNTPGNVAAAPLAGIIFSASGGNWHALIAYSGSVQILAGACMLYGTSIGMGVRGESS